MESINLEVLACEGGYVVAEYDLMPFSTPRLASMAAQIAGMAYRRGQEDLRKQINALLKEK